MYLIFSGYVLIGQKIPEVISEKYNLTPLNIVLQKKFYVKIKYRDDEINLKDTAFNYRNTATSSFIKGAWYDDKQNYFIFNLNDTYYHYCNVPTLIWKEFEVVDLYGDFYNQKIRGNYSCQYKEVPIY